RPNLFQVLDNDLRFVHRIVPIFQIGNSTGWAAGVRPIQSAWHGFDFFKRQFQFYQGNLHLIEVGAYRCAVQAQCLAHIPLALQAAKTRQLSPSLAAPYSCCTQWLRSASTPRWFMCPLYVIAPSSILGGESSNKARAIRVLLAGYCWLQSRMPSAIFANRGGWLVICTSLASLS